ncbi:KR domain-containing protein [Stachybotrys elegans]|uniref:KR domain-containing protein n=1 Tax=Stachybotrys elegans TaxID=80388 RepID=A0A8K0WLK5_9HYPO|nr:KR domain-containing protein [Stachybotrys elegans]
MVRQGAKHLAFVSRSGADSPAAAQTVQELQAQGAKPLVLRADITKRGDLERALLEIDPSTPVRGVINAASVFRGGLFSKATVDAWREVVDTKVKGSLMLHELLKDKPLDFFVMTSSVASALGSSGQTNYSAANSFLDSLARHRHSQGLPAVSLILPAIFGIGHIAENRELEKAIQIKGMYGIREEEMLQAFEVAMTQQSSLPAGTDHIIVGLQPRRIGPAVRAAGAAMLSKENPRLNWVATVTAGQAVGSGSGGGSGGGGAEEVRTALARADGKEEAASVASHGLDSMIGAEFRNWIFREFQVNVPFQQLLAGSLTIAQLAGMICEQASS